ncbi:hypothetical protein HOY80DRAFT_1062261 [Tuber brumale]|nr:hypothetical protein HOY80DRAFT_1062261 [Tuber brumale]
MGSIERRSEDGGASRGLRLRLDERALTRFEDDNSVSSLSAGGRVLVELKVAARASKVVESLASHGASSVVAEKSEQSSGIVMGPAPCIRRRSEAGPDPVWRGGARRSQGLSGIAPAFTNAGALDGGAGRKHPSGLRAESNIYQEAERKWPGGGWGWLGDLASREYRGNRRWSRAQTSNLSHGRMTCLIMAARRETSNIDLEAMRKRSESELECLAAIVPNVVAAAHERRVSSAFPSLLEWRLREKWCDIYSPKVSSSRYGFV